MLSRKYYVLIAKVIKDNLAEDKSGNGKRLLDKDNLVNDLALDFKRDNSLFCASKFVDACE
tara:strand:- start:168 stop:350 length:183 start_codon:yes stop_codon:yes gene_type:complete